jgi:nucleoside diphosphate kinase
MDTKNIISTTFVLVYPGAVCHIPEILDVTQKSSFKLLELKPFDLSKEVAEKLFDGEDLESYRKRVRRTKKLLKPEDKNFYSSSQPAVALIFGHPSRDAISVFENLISSVIEGEIISKLWLFTNPFLYHAKTINLEMTKKLFPDFDFSSFNYKD